MSSYWKRNQSIAGSIEYQFVYGKDFGLVYMFDWIFPVAANDGGGVGYFRNLNQIQFASSIILDIIYADNS